MNARFLTQVLAAAALLCGPLLSIQAQDNLVPNGSFEEADVRRLKNYGQLEEFCAPWFPLTEAALDLYAEGMKGEKVNIPNNLYGKQEASEGSNYAGFRAYSKNTRLFRQYYQVKLTESLEENQMYCVSFDLSLADMSRYAVNGIGAYLSDRKLAQGNTGVFVTEPSVRHHANKVMMFYDGWETICGTVIGTGEEEYLIIGAFAGDSDMEIEKVKRPAGFVGAQEAHAYYYLDNVQVHPVEAKSQCTCSAADEVKEDLVYGSSTVLNENMSDAEKLSVMAVYYAFLKRTATGAGNQTIASVAEMMAANPSWKLRVVGHADDDEYNEGRVNARYAALGEKRANIVVNALIEAGVPADRIVVDARENEDPASTRDTDISRAQNRRVTFELIQ
jgi:outer membrane protein OmpA-like peptidoglycan-associated protein